MGGLQKLGEDFCCLHLDRRLFLHGGLQCQTAETVRSIPLFSHTNCFIFPIKQPLCLSALSAHGETARCNDETQTDYLV